MRSMDGSDGVEGFEVELPFSVVLPGSAGLSGSSPPQDVNNTDYRQHHDWFKILVHYFRTCRPRSRADIDENKEAWNDVLV